jgi:HlyD family secretion protein
MTVVSIPPHPHSINASPANGRRRLAMVLVPILGAALAVGAYWTYVKFTSRAGPSLVGAKFFSVTPTDMEIKVSKDGELQAVNNIDIQCQVEGGSTIVQIVKEGASVKKGDVLVVLDSSLIRQKMDDAQLALQTAEADVTTAKEMLDIQQSQNAANLDAAKVDLELAKLAVQQYTEGTYPADLQTAKTTLEMAKITVANKEDDLKQTRELYAKNFVTLADVKTAELNLTTVQNDMKKAESALLVLEKYTHTMEIAAKNSYLAQAEQKLARTQHENASNLLQKRADYEAKEQKLALMKRQFARLQEQLDNTTIKAPAEGLVVYAQNRDSSAPIQEGTQVRERQILLRLPDTTAMKAVIKVNESQVSRLSPGQRANVKVTGVPELIPATVTKISPVADSSQRWWNPDVREYPVELTLEWTPQNLKPGIGCQSEILVDSIPNALAVPLAALYSQGTDNFVFVHKADQAEARRVSIGQANETHARVTQGLTGGEEVLLLQPGQGRDLLERAGIQLSPPEQPKRKSKSKEPKEPPPGAPKGGEARVDPKGVAKADPDGPDHPRAADVSPASGANHTEPPARRG